jgi:hypothetical protein
MTTNHLKMEVEPTPETLCFFFKYTSGADSVQHSVPITVKKLLDFMKTKCSGLEAD